MTGTTAARAALQARIDACRGCASRICRRRSSPARACAAALGGPTIWIKRDDLTGLAFGGNKTRQLEFVFADVLARGRRYRGRRRLHPVQLVPPDDRGGEEARARGRAGPAARREGAGAAGQPAARPADGRRRHRGRPRQHGAPAAPARGQGRGARARRPQALRRWRRSRSTGRRSARSATSTPRSSSTRSSTQLGIDPDCLYVCGANMTPAGPRARAEGARPAHPAGQHRADPLERGARARHRPDRQRDRPAPRPRPRLRADRDREPRRLHRRALRRRHRGRPRGAAAARAHRGGDPRPGLQQQGDGRADRPHPPRPDRPRRDRGLRPHRRHARAVRLRRRPRPRLSGNRSARRPPRIIVPWE